MATRRMFSKTITNSSNFLMMPQSTQNLYFHLGMNADDDGFCEHFTIMRMTESKPDDLKILQAKGFVHVFDDRVLIILDWKENNYLRSDRYTPSKYIELYKNELKQLSENSCPHSGIPSGTPAVDSGKDRIGKGNKGKKRGANRVLPESLQEVRDYCIIKGLKVDPDYYYKYFSESNWTDSRGNHVQNWKLKILSWNNMGYGIKKESDNKSIYPVIA